MAVYDILPDTNLKAEDIRDTLNAGGGNVGNNTLDYFTDAANINPDSKEKPMEIDAPFDISDAQKRNACYGFDIPTSTLPDNSLYFANPTALGEWEYRLPTGLKRLGDFRGYDYKVRVEKGDWGIFNTYLAGADNTGGFITKILNSDVKKYIDNGIGVKMRASHPSKPTQICPKDIPLLGHLGYFVYKASPDTNPSWRLVEVKIDTNPVNVTNGYSGTVRFSSLGITSSNIDAGIEMYIRIVGVCFKIYHTDLNSTGIKSSLNYKGISQVHDVTITSGAYYQVNQVQWQRTTWNNKPSIALHGNALVLPSCPASAPVRAYLSANVRVYSESGTLLKTLPRSITYSSQEYPVINTIINVRKEFYIEDLPYNWYKLEGEFIGPDNTNRYVKCDTVSILKSQLGL